MSSLICQRYELIQTPANNEVTVIELPEGRLQEIRLVSEFLVAVNANYVVTLNETKLQNFEIYAPYSRMHVGIITLDEPIRDGQEISITAGTSSTNGLLVSFMYQDDRAVGFLERLTDMVDRGAEWAKRFVSGW